MLCMYVMYVRAYAMLCYVMCMHVMYECYVMFICYDMYDCYVMCARLVCMYFVGVCACFVCT